MMNWYNDLPMEAIEAVGNWEKDTQFRSGLNRIENTCDPKTQTIITYETFSLMGEKCVLDRANEKALIEALDQYINCDNPTVEQRWCNGEYILIVTALDDNGDETDAWTEIVEIARGLCDYPVMDENLYSVMEAEKANEEIESMLSTLEIDQLKGGLFEYLTGYHSVDDYCEQLAIKNGLENWWPNLHEIQQKQIIEVIHKEDRAMLVRTIAEIEKTDWLNEAVEEMNRWQLEKLQEKIVGLLKLKVVGD